MTLCYGSLVKEAIMLLDKFAVDRQCLDEFLADAETDLQCLATLERTFILELVSGCIEHKTLLDVVIKAFNDQNGGVDKCDHTKFAIVCYVATFCLDDLELKHFKSIVTSLGTGRTIKFLNFFFSNLTSCIQDEWNCIYDAAFVERNFIDPLLRWRPKINSLMDQLSPKISEGSKKAAVKTTKPKEFSLSKSTHKTPPVPEPDPELLQQQEKYKPVPKSTYRAPKEMQLISQIKETNHLKAQELLYEANVNQFRCTNPEKSEYTKRVIAQIEEDMNAQLKFNACYSSRRPPSNKQTDNFPIKLNNTAILRQEAMYGRRVKEELQRIEQLAQGGREPSSFLLWQREMLEKDRQDKLPMIEQKRQDAHLSAERAVLARKQIQERNQRVVQLSKEERAQLMQRYAEKRLQEEKELRDLVQQVAEDQKKSKEAKGKIQKLKQRIVKEVSEQNQELLRQALEEEQAKFCKKFERTHKVHTLETLPRIRFNKFDDTETGGHRLLEEMSLVEVKERLAQVKRVQQTEQEERRRRILKERQKKKQLQQKRLETIELFSRLNAKAAAIKSGQPLT